jgi:ribosomal protein RSM22 (predicted rRNA methylase)
LRRIIRPPRKRGGHIVLDVCTGRCGGSSSEQSEQQAAIVRHTVARSDAHKWMGSAGYELAKSANWGDLWPAAYDANEKQQVVNVSSSSSSS